MRLEDLLALLRWAQRVEDAVAATLEAELDAPTRALLVRLELEAPRN